MTVHPFVGRFEGQEPADPDWLRPRRKEAWHRFQAHPVPDREAWRYSDARAILERPWAPAPRRDTMVDAPELPGPRVAFVDGRFDAEASWVGDAAGPLGDEEAAVGHLVQPHHPFADLNLACFEDAALVTGTAHIVHVATGQADTAHHPRSLIRIPRNAKAIVVEQFLSAPEAQRSWTDAVTEIILDKGARLSYIRLQDESPTSIHTGGVAARLGPDTRLHAYDFHFGGAHDRVTFDAKLAGEGAELALEGLVAARGTQRSDVYTRIDHAVPHTSSHERYRTILDDQARGGFTGHIHVAHDAQQTQSDQEHRNLLLSREALAQTTPQLEINADDVKCSHGSTVGQLDEAQLFFLRSRGIGHERARAMLVEGFAHEVTGALPVLREHIESRVRTWFAGGRP